MRLFRLSGSKINFKCKILKYKKNQRLRLWFFLLLLQPEAVANVACPSFAEASASGENFEHR